MQQVYNIRLLLTRGKFKYLPLSHFGGLGLAPSENFKITVYNDRLYSMRDPLQ